MNNDFNSLTLSEFIDLVCRYHDNIQTYSLSQDDIGRMRTVLLEYQEIASPGSITSLLFSNERVMKSRIVHNVMNICRYLYTCGLIEQVKTILIEYEPSASTWSKSRIEGEIELRVQRALREIEEAMLEKNDSTLDSNSIRRQFYQQIACIMAHFKFQIEPTTMKASLYANLVAQYSREMKLMKASMKK